MGRYGSLLSVAIGGIVGSAVRWAAVSAAGDGRAELVVFGLNVIGSALLGVLIGSRRRLTDEQFHLIGSGFAGGMTTFSDYAVAVAQRLEEGALVAAATNGIGTMLIALVAGGVGYRIGRQRP